MSRCRDDVEALTAPSSGAADTPKLFGEMLNQLASAMEIRDIDGGAAKGTLRKAMNYSQDLRGKRARGLLTGVG